MEDFQDLFNNAVKIKNAEMAAKRKVFEQKPQYIKCGLYYWPKFEATRQHAFHQRYFAAELMKSQGNIFFKTQQFDRAVKEYEQSLSIFRYIRNKNKNWRKEGIIDSDLIYIDDSGNTQYEQIMITKLKLALYHNLAAGYLRLKQFSLAKFVSDEALQIEPRSTKALFRRAKSLILDINSDLQDYKSAQKDLKYALELEPKDQEIQSLYNHIGQEIQKMKDSNNQFGKNIFQKKEERLKRQQAELIQKQKENDEQQKLLKEQLNQDANKVLLAARQKLIEKEKKDQELKKKAQQKQTRGRSKGKNQQQVNNSQNSVNDENDRPQSTQSCKEISKAEQIAQNQKQQSQTKSKKNKSQNSQSLQQQKQQGKQQQQQQQQQVLKNSNQAQKNYEQMEKDQQQKNKNVQQFWKMFNIQKDYDNFDYDLSYHQDPNAKIPIEIKELGRFIDTKGKEMVELFEEAGKMKEARELKDKLNKAKAAKKQLEKIAKLDFNRPTDKLVEIAEKYGIDLYDESIKNEFRKIQEQNLVDIRNWLSSNDCPIPEEKQTKFVYNNNNDDSNGSHSQSTQEGDGSSTVLVTTKKKKKRKKKGGKNGNASDLNQSMQSNTNSEQTYDLGSENGNQSQKINQLQQQQQHRRMQHQNMEQQKQLLQEKYKQKRQQSLKKKNQQLNDISNNQQQQQQQQSYSWKRNYDNFENELDDFEQEQKQNRKKSLSRQNSKHKRKSSSVKRKKYNNQEDLDSEDLQNSSDYEREQKRKIKLKRSSSKSKNRGHSRSRSKRKHNNDSSENSDSEEEEDSYDSRRHKKKRSQSKRRSKSNSKKRRRTPSSSENSNSSDEEEDSREERRRKRNRSKSRKRSVSRKNKKRHNDSSYSSENSEEEEDDSRDSSRERRKRKSKKKRSSSSRKKKRDDSSEENSSDSDRYSKNKKNYQVAKYNGSNTVAKTDKKGKKSSKSSKCTDVAIPKNRDKKKKKLDYAHRFIESEKPNHLPLPPYKLDEEGKPVVPTLEELNNPIFHNGYYPELEINYSNPISDPNIQISKNNKHNNKVEDFQTKGNYNKLDFNPEKVELKDRKQTMQTKQILEKERSTSVQVKDEDDGFISQLIILISVGLFIISILYHFFSSQDNVDDIESAEKLLGKDTTSQFVAYEEPDIIDNTF